MRVIKNSYFLAILKATDNGKFPEYSDLWRCYHPFASMFDSDYSLFTESRFFSHADSLLFSSEPESSQAVLGVPREERSGAVQSRTKILYVPVTRKVSSRSRKNPRNLTCKVSLTDETKPTDSPCKVSPLERKNSLKLH